MRNYLKSKIDKSDPKLWKVTFFESVGDDRHFQNVGTLMMDPGVSIQFLEALQRGHSNAFIVDVPLTSD